MRRIGYCLGFGLLAACQSAEMPADTRTAPAAATTDAPSPAPEPSPVASLAEVEGRWDIVRFEDYRPESRLQGSTPATFAHFRTAMGGSVGLRIECNYSGAAGSIVDGQWRARPSDGIQTSMGCGSEGEARDSRLFAFFDLEPTIRRQSDGRLLVTAPDGRELVLERPEQRRLAFRISAADLLGDWRMEEVHYQYEEGGFAGIGLGEVPGRIRFEQGRAYYTRCADEAVRTSYEEELGMLRKIGDAPLPTQADCPALRSDFGGANDMPSAIDVLTALHSNPFMERSGDRLVMQAGEIAVTLTKAPCEELWQSDDHSRSEVRDCASPL